MLVDRVFKTLGVSAKPCGNDCQPDFPRTCQLLELQEGAPFQDLSSFPRAVDRRRTLGSRSLVARRGAPVTHQDQGFVRRADLARAPGCTAGSPRKPSVPRPVQSLRPDLSVAQGHGFAGWRSNPVLARDAGATNSSGSGGGDRHWHAIKAPGFSNASSGHYQCRSPSRLSFRTLLRHQTRCHP